MARLAVLKSECNRVRTLRTHAMASGLVTRRINTRFETIMMRGHDLLAADRVIHAYAR